MNRDIFEERYRSDWTELEILLLQLEKARASPDLGSFPKLYRQVCQQLALARARGYGADLERRLNDLALRGHQQLYRHRPLSYRGLLDLMTWRFPQLVRREAKAFWLAMTLTFVPGLLAYGSIMIRPELVYAFVSPADAAQMEAMYQSAGAMEAARPVESDLVMFGFYIYNNVRIDFRTFAGGMLFGVGAILVLMLNGIQFGAVSAHLQQAELGEVFYPFVIGHGSFEIIGMVLAGTAGLRLGGALLSPGRKRRLVALRDRALYLLPIVYGTAIFTFVAAFIEAFWSSKPTPPELRYGVGALLWLLVALYLLLAGRGRLVLDTEPSSES